MRNEHGDGLSQHGGFSLNAAHSPAQHTNAVNHRGMRVGADHRVGISNSISTEHDPGQVLQVDLVDDARIRWHHAEITESRLSPAQEAVTLLVALEFDAIIQGQGVCAAVAVHLHGMVNHQFRRRKRVDLVRTATQGCHCIPHGGEIDDSRHAGEILQQYARWRKCNFRDGCGCGIPVAQCFYVLPCHVNTVFVAQQVFEQDLETERQA